MKQHWSIDAANDAVNAIPPAWSLDATVAVNPFLGQSDRGMAETAALLERVSGERIFPTRADFRARRESGEITDTDLVDALFAHGAPVDLAELKRWIDRDVATPPALRTVTEIASATTGTDWHTITLERIGAFLGAEFDLGQALWAQPRRETVWETWRAYARRDVTPEIHGLTGFAAEVAALPPEPGRALEVLSDALGLDAVSAPTVYHRLLTDLGGWGQLARQRLFEAAKHGHADGSTRDLLLIRLAFEAAALRVFSREISSEWAAVRALHAEPVRPSGDNLIDTILQDAAERAATRALSTRLRDTVPEEMSGRPRVQAAFCIDVRSEVFRRALETVDPDVETLGFAGFFGLGVAHKGFASDVVEPRLPVLLAPQLTTTSAGDEDDLNARYLTRAKRAWGRFKLAAVSSFAFVEASGPLYAGKLVKDALGAGSEASFGPAPRLDPALPAEARIAAAKTVLSAMSLTRGFAPLVILMGHGANVTNAPHESALHCGACGGYAGDVNARLLAGLLNDVVVRKGLRDQGIDIPEDTLFIGGLHDTTTDAVTLFDADVAADAHAAEIATFRAQLAKAAIVARGDRAGRLPRAEGAADIARRSMDWSETRPEWALAGCSAFIAAPRDRTRGRDLSGRAFLHNYDWQADEDFGVLELIMTAPVVVASWISLQYYGSTVAPDAFGGGTKVLHNVVGGFGVVEGNGGRLRTGLPFQSVHDGDRFVHDPLRLNVVIEAPREAMEGILAKHPGVAELFDNGWLKLIAMDGLGRLAWRYLPGGGWEAIEDEPESPDEMRLAAE